VFATFHLSLPIIIFCMSTQNTTFNISFSKSPQTKPPMIMKVTPVQVFLLILTFFSVSALVPSRSSSGSQLARQYRTGSDFAETLVLAPPHPISPFFDETDWATALPTLDEAFQVMKNGGSIICPSAL